MVRIDSNISSIYSGYSSGLKKNSEAQQTKNPFASFKAALQKDIFEKKAEQLSNENQAISDKLKALTSPISQKAVAFAGNVKAKAEVASSYVTPIFNKDQARVWKVKDLRAKSVSEIDGIFRETVAKNK